MITLASYMYAITQNIIKHALEATSEHMHVSTQAVFGRRVVSSIRGHQSVATVQTGMRMLCQWAYVCICACRTLC